MFEVKELAHIDVCICTYKRTELLKRLLLKLEVQETEDQFDYSIIIVDNDRSESGRQIVETFSKKSKKSIKYYVESEQNIALARNKAIENAKGDFVALIDDDEFPVSNWLLNLYKIYNNYEVNGVLGPVLPYFEGNPPGWIVRGKFCERKSFPTGTIINKSEHTRTGNVLISNKLFSDLNQPFDPRYGKTGGEDVDFFNRMILKKSIFVWCNEAEVYEAVPIYRMKRGYFIKRALLRGVVNAEKVSFLSLNALKSTMAILLYTLVLPFFLLIRHDLFMKYLIRDCDHLGKIMALFGLKLVVERSVWIDKN